MANVPYGTMGELEKENGNYLLNSAKLKANALKDCIDILKPMLLENKFLADTWLSKSHKDFVAKIIVLDNLNYSIM